MTVHEQMHRRSRTGKGIALLGVLLAGLGVAAVAGYLAIQANGFSSNADAFPPYERYRASPANFLGNEYQLEAIIDSQLKYEEGLGRILAVTPIGSEHRLPVFVPETVQNNVHVGQRYRMIVQVRRGGRIEAQTLEKF